MLWAIFVCFFVVVVVVVFLGGKQRQNEPMLNWFAIEILLKNTLSFFHQQALSLSSVYEMTDRQTDRNKGRETDTDRQTGERQTDKIDTMEY